ncbi:MAG: HD domain-containing phosphohydrolase [Planctomycetota bacterium]
MIPGSSPSINDASDVVPTISLGTIGVDAPDKSRHGDADIGAIDRRLDELQQLNESLSGNVDQLSELLCDKFEEVRLIHDLTARLELDDDPTEVCDDLLVQLHDCLHCESLIIQLDPEDEEIIGGSMQGVGEPITLSQLDEIIDAAITENAQKANLHSEPLLVNHGFLPAIAERRVLILPIHRRGQRLGRLIAIRSLQEDEFGTVEVDLARSILMVLSLHLVSQRQYAEMQSMLKGTVSSLAAALDAKDAYTHGHSSRVADLAMMLAKRLRLPNDSVEALQLAGILHDIGKIGIDDSVLKKPGKLTPEEFDQIKLHPVFGYEILKDIRPFRHILPAVRHHHESWDGTGYPDGLAGNAIPRDAQILAVADAFDAMVSDRPYRRGMPIEKVLQIFREGRGKQWAADVVDVLLSSEDLLRRLVLQQTQSTTH